MPVLGATVTADDALDLVDECCSRAELELDVAVGVVAVVAAGGGRAGLGPLLVAGRLRS